MRLGRHAIADIYECNNTKIDDIEEVKKIILDAVFETNLHVVDMKFHKFSPIGISGVLILAESHLTIHTWPEYKYIGLDVFTCGEKVNPQKTCELIAKKFNSNKYNIFEIERGKEYELSGTGN